MVPSLPPSPLTATVDFAADGVQHGFLRLPYSRDDSAWGSVMIPTAVVRNGVGPTALLTGGNHGDEYEGPLALYELARTLDPAAVSGAVIIIPALNTPAFRAGTRTSPIDRGNLNRSFPGNPEGTVTQKIADYVSRVLLVTIELEGHTPAHFRGFEAAVERLEPIVAAWSLGGGIDYLLRVIARDIDSYQRLIDTLLESRAGVARYFTYVVTGEVKTVGAPPFAELLGDPSG